MLKVLKSLKRPKISNKKLYLTFLKVSPETKKCPYFILKLKTNRNLKKKI